MANEFRCDTPKVRDFIGQVQEIMAGTPAIKDRLAAIRPRFSQLL